MVHDMATRDIGHAHTDKMVRAFEKKVCPYGLAVSTPRRNYFFVKVLKGKRYVFFQSEGLLHLFFVIKIFPLRQIKAAVVSSIKSEL